MSYADLRGAITAADAEDDDAPLFALALELPHDLLARGFRLVTRSDGRMYAVSTNAGCTSTKGTVDEVVTEARGVASFCAAMDRKRR